MKETAIIIAAVLLTVFLIQFLSPEKDPNRATDPIPEAAFSAREESDRSAYKLKSFGKNGNDTGSQYLKELAKDFPPEPDIYGNEINQDGAQNRQQIKAGQAGQFTIVINDEAYTRSQTIYTSTPVYATFKHPNPHVTHVRMEYPDKPDLYIDYPIGEKVRIQIHESYIQAGVFSYSDFIAQDDQGNPYDKIRLVFAP